MTGDRATTARVVISGPAGEIEAIIEDPGGSADFFGIVCHPHPLFGGTMDNKVVDALARGLRECGIPTLRFNFRGVGASAGSFDAGIGETLDAEAVADFGVLRWSGRQLVIAGFSFGSFVAMRLAERRPPSHLILVAPPVERFDFSSLALPVCPWLVIQGDADDVVDPHAVLNWVAGLPVVPRLVVMPGVGHFFHGRLLELRSEVVQTIRSG